MSTFKWFHSFYGPKPAQFKEYLLQSKLKEDERYEFIVKTIEFWFVHREALKAKSNLHKYLLIKE